MINQISHPIGEAAAILSQKERQFLDASVAVEAALADGQTGVSELERLNEIAAELAQIAEFLSDHLQTQLASFLE